MSDQSKAEQGVAAADWRMLTVAEGTQGLGYEFAAQRVGKSREELQGRRRWLILRRNLDGSELEYYLSNAPADMLLSQRAHADSMRWCIEPDLQTTKGEKGWHHHVALAMLAAACSHAKRRTKKRQ